MDNIENAVDRPIHPWAAEGRNRIRFGIFGGTGADWRQSVAWVQRIEELGFDSFWTGDHPMHFPFDCWTHLAVLAAATSRIRLGSLVSCPFYRHPTILARQVADVDRLSGGRVVLGLGIGDDPPEFQGLGVPYGSVRERQTALSEALTILPALLRGETVTFAGTAFQLDGTGIAPSAIQQPHVPILVAGGGERVTLRQVARFADVSNMGAGNLVGGAWSPDDLRRKHAVLDRHCAEAGRSPDAVLRTHISFNFSLRREAEATWNRYYDEAFDFAFDYFSGPPAAAVEYFQSLAEAGVQYFIVGVNEDAESLRLLGEAVLPALAG